MKVNPQQESNAVKAPYVWNGEEALTVARSMAYFAMTSQDRILKALMAGDHQDFENQIAFVGALKAIHSTSTSDDGDNPPATNRYTLQLGAQDAFVLGVALHLYGVSAKRAAENADDSGINAAFTDHNEPEPSAEMKAELRQRALEDSPRAFRLCRELGAWAATLDPASIAEATRAVAEERATEERTGFWQGHEEAETEYTDFITNFLGAVPPSATLN